MSEPSAQRGAPRRRRANRATLLRSAIVVGVILLWEILVRTGVVDGHFLSAPTEVVRAMADLMGDPGAQEAFRRTGWSILLAFVMGTSAGLLVALALGASRLLREAFLGPIIGTPT